MASIKKKLSKKLLKTLGWKFIGEVPTEKKYVVIVAPHTSALDMLYVKLYHWAFGMKPKIMVKKEFFFFPVGYILKIWGAIPINRKYAGGVVNQMADIFKTSDEFIIGIAPEGTRNANSEWKTGFYRIAEAAKVPLFLTVIDFKNKEIGFLGEQEITGDIEKDIASIKEKYKDAEGYHKDKFVI